MVNNKGTDQTVQAGLHLCCSHATVRFSCIKAHICENFSYKCLNLSYSANPLVKSVLTDSCSHFSTKTHLAGRQKNVSEFF